MHFLLPVLLLVLFGCVDPDNKNTKKNSRISQINPLPDSELSQYQACQSASDCIFVNNGCCDCINIGYTKDRKQVKSGKETAINASKKEEFESLLSCNEVVECTEVARFPRCGSGKVTCEKNLCTYTRPKYP